jgi:chromosome segregation ATPase
MSSGSQFTDVVPASDPLPNVSLEVRQAGGRPAPYALGQLAFLVGTVPGCDLRLSGADLPALVCLLCPHPGGVALRKLGIGPPLFVNGLPTNPTQLADGDRLTIGFTDIVVRIRQPSVAPTAPAAPDMTRIQLHEAVAQFRAQLLNFEQEKERHERERELQIRQYEADVLRLDRQRGDLEKRDLELRKAAADAEQQRARLQTVSGEFEEQVSQLDEWRVRHGEIQERLTRQEQEQKTLDGQLAQRAAALEGQQATVASLRTRLERLREDLRVREQQFDEQQAGQDAERQRLEQERQELERLRDEVDGERRLIESERQQWTERTAVLENATRQLRLAQQRVADEELRLTQRAGELETRNAQCAEQESLLQDRLTQLAEAQERAVAERQALRDRATDRAKSEQARESLQEQLRRRSEELNARQKALDELAAQHQQGLAEFDERRARAKDEHADDALRLAALQDELGRRASDLDQQIAALAGREQAQRTQAEQLAGESRTLHDEQARFRQEHQQALERLAQERAECEAMRREASELFEQLPEVELRVGAGLDRLAHARTQLGEHLAEVHQYVRQCQDELERLRGRVQVDVERLEEQEQALRRGQDEHRLAMVAFRQQLIDWQGQVAEMKRALAQNETRLERRQAQVDEKVKEIDASSQRLARQAEELQEQQREVQDRRHEVDAHLIDMREWYRRKLRDLAGIPECDPSAPPEHETPAPAPNDAALDDHALIPIARGILAMGSAGDSGDHRLGETLRTLQLVDADALTALLAEARRQRRSLRQVLLASGAVTLYQLALIEAGNIAGLMLGPVRVIDRLRSTPFEAVYRVFDPRRGTEAVLRHLAEAPMHDAVRPDEFRQRFGQAVLSDAHLAATLEVLEIAGRPAALQEWLSGLPATDWPPLAAAPGVCYRLLTQAARGLSVAHRAGLVHGHLSDALLLLNGDGVLKLCGLGEPPWLAGQTEDDASVRGDLHALGAIVSGWCTPSGVRRGARAKPLPEALVSVLYRLNADGDAGYASAGELLDDLEKAATAVPPNAEAWERLLRYVREHGTPDAALRRSA